MLQRSATHCKTLQHTATHGNMLQHTGLAAGCSAGFLLERLGQVQISLSFYWISATHCNTLHHTAIHCNTLQHAAQNKNAFHTIG